MKFGIIGSAHGHIFEFIDEMITLGWKFVGIVDDKQPNVLKISEKYNIPILKNEEELFAKNINIIGCSAVNNQKIDIIELCDKNNVHIMCDKPLVINRKDYNRLEAVIKKNNIKVGLMLTLRFEESIKSLKNIVDSGKLGKLIHMEIMNPHKLNPEKRPEWHFLREKNGGVVIDLLVHSVDLFNWFAKGNLVQHSCLVTKSILPEKKGFYDFSIANVLNDTGTSGYLRADWHMTRSHWSWGDIRLFCICTDGYAEVRATGDPISRDKMLIVYKSDKPTQIVELDNITETVTKDFLRKIDGKEHCITDDEILYVCDITIKLDECTKINKM